MHDGTYVAGAALPAHGQAKANLRFASACLAPAHHPLFAPRLMVARDAQRGWWDCLRGRRIRSWDRWCPAELTRLGITDVALEMSEDGTDMKVNPLH
jgi:hypothetical protein